MAGYPNEATARPGSASTAFAAADLVNKTVKTMLARIEADYLANGPGTPEEVHARIALPGERLLLTSVRARICQLHRLGRLVDSGTRGLGESLRAKVIRWRLATAEELALFYARKAAAAEKDGHDE